MTTPVHRENGPPFDVEACERRIVERRAYTGAPLSPSAKATIDADTDMIEGLVREARRLRAANVALREVIESMRPKAK